MKPFLEIEETGQIEALRMICADVEQRDDVGGLLILTCDANAYTPELLDPILQSCSCPLIGAVFPEVVVGNRSIAVGSIVVGLKHRPHLFSIAGLSDETVDCEEEIRQAVPAIGNAQTALVFVDAFAKRISSLLEGLFNNFGLEVNYLGGGAGSLSLLQKPCLMTNQGMLKDAAVVALFDLPSGVAVQHGWQTLAGPFKATESSRGTILTLDWEPAFDVYRNVLDKNAQGSVFPEDFYATAQNFPFGMRKLDAEMVVRDPISVGTRGELICVGEVPVNSYLHILQGDKRELINAASQALQVAHERHPAPNEETPILLFDCISRSIFMGEDFLAELDVLGGGNRVSFGALTLGEIANSGRSYLEFFNKSVVVGVVDL